MEENDIECPTADTPHLERLEQIKCREKEWEEYSSKTVKFDEKDIGFFGGHLYEIAETCELIETIKLVKKVGGMHHEVDFCNIKLQDERPFDFGTNFPMISPPLPWVFDEATKTAEGGGRLLNLESLPTKLYTTPISENFRVNFSGEFINLVNQINKEEFVINGEMLHFIIKNRKLLSSCGLLRDIEEWRNKDIETAMRHWRDQFPSLSNRPVL